MSDSKRVKGNDDLVDGETDGGCSAGHPASPITSVATTVAVDSVDHLTYISGWFDVVSTIRERVETDDFTVVPADERAQKMNSILSRVRTEGHLVRVNLDAAFWMRGELPDEVELFINPFPAIYSSWIAGQRVRQCVYELWAGLEQRPSEGFFFWLHSTIALLAIHASPDQVSSFNGLLREASRHGTDATLHAQRLFNFGHVAKEMLDDQMRTSLAKQMLYAWAATNFAAFTALASRLSTAGPEEEQWWLLDAETRNELARCDSSPLPYVPVPKDARFVFA